MLDLCIPTESESDPRIAALRQTVRSTSYRRLLGDLPGYDVSTTGEQECVD
jgi:hypothetical protein